VVSRIPIPLSVQYIEYGDSRKYRVDPRDRRQKAGMLPAGFEPTSEGILGGPVDASKALYP
jgi:hypothetical protein